MKAPRWVVPERLWANVDRSDAGGCWPWLGRLNSGGYGQNAPHRRAYEIANGAIPEGLTVDHLCFNPACCNPAHMEVVTLAENLRRQRKAAATHCVNGHPFTDSNTYRAPGGWRSCRTCRNQASNAYKARRRAA